MTDVNHITGSTRVTYPHGFTSGRSVVLLWERCSPGRDIVIVEETPFHPVDHRWPDQPADHGAIVVDQNSFEVVDVLTAAIDPESGQLCVDGDIPVARGEDRWIFLIAHVVAMSDQTATTNLLHGEATLEVDVERRRVLSAAHTACHLAALALNRSTRHLWRKEIPADSLGNPDLDQRALQRSEISTSGSVDTYRFGKSLRKSGFASNELFNDLHAIEETLEKQIAGWIATGSEVVMETTNGIFGSRCLWKCELPDGAAEMPCGGTHVSNLGEIESVKVCFEKASSSPELILRTTPLVE